jgi:hypothetical protein
LGASGANVTGLNDSSDEKPAAYWPRTNGLPNWSVNLGDTAFTTSGTGRICGRIIVVANDPMWRSATDEHRASWLVVKLPQQHQGEQFGVHWDGSLAQEASARRRFQRPDGCFVQPLQAGDDVKSAWGEIIQRGIDVDVKFVAAGVAAIRDDAMAFPVPHLDRYDVLAATFGAGELRHKAAHATTERIGLGIRDLPSASASDRGAENVEAQEARRLSAGFRWILRIQRLRHDIDRAVAALWPTPDHAAVGAVKIVHVVPLAHLNRW